MSFVIDMNASLHRIGPSRAARHDTIRFARIAPLAVQAHARADAERLSGAIPTKRADRLRPRALAFDRKE